MSDENAAKSELNYLCREIARLRGLAQVSGLGAVVDVLDMAYIEAQRLATEADRPSNSDTVVDLSSRIEKKKSENQDEMPDGG